MSNMIFCRSCGAQMHESAPTCPKCGAINEAVISSPVALTPDTIPPGVKGWSWGAFFLNWIWAAGNQVWWGLLALVPFVGIIMTVILGIKGREWAWKAKKWQSVDDFNRVQKKWSMWALIIVGVTFVVGILSAIAIPAYQDYKVRAIAAQYGSSPMSDSSSVPASTPLPNSASIPLSTSTADSAPVTAPAGKPIPFGSDSSSLTLPLNTPAGPLAVVSDTPSSTGYITLNGQRLFSGEDASWQAPVMDLKLSGGRDAILMVSSGGRGNSCPSLFYFLVIGNSSSTYTPEFGTCAEQGTLQQSGDTIFLTFPKMGGTDTYVFDGNAVTLNGKAITMTDDADPSK